MKFFNRAHLAATIVIASVAAGAIAKDPPKPSAPDIKIPELVGSKATAICVLCRDQFDTATHKEMLAKLVANPFNAELRKALYMQDVAHQFESKAHFDNCDFDTSMSYVKELLAEVGAHAERAKQAELDKDDPARTAAVKSAFFALGQAVHGVQDFYAHSNYVEIEAPKVSKVSAIRVLPFWTDGGVADVQKLVATGLKSGFVFWGFPQKCPSGSKSHSDLAKDSESTKSGKVRLAHLQNTSQYTVSVYLASEASKKLLVHAYKTWPILERTAGPNIAFETGPDQRGI